MMQRPVWSKVRKESWWLLGALAVLLACIWPVRSLQKLPKQQAALQQQMMRVQALAQEAAQLQAQLLPSADQPAQVKLQAWLQTYVADKGSLVMAGDTATVTLQSVPQAQLATVLSSLRQEVPVQMREVQLRQSAGGISGRLELQLPEVR